MKSSKSIPTKSGQSLKFKKLWIGIVILIILSPIGLAFPEFFKASGAWGEWGVDELKDIVGYIPEGLKKLSELQILFLPCSEG
ncbi:MAG: hypothetical protein ACOYU0_09610 [Nitrospirota bacterium]